MTQEFKGLNSKQCADILDSLIFAQLHAEECAAMEKAGLTTGYKKGFPAEMSRKADRSIKAWEATQ
ncbi:hypothetical protein [Epibacterium ulvae]|uniref:hypothetical protein n=1 Tax=Epibacterium ulvae TaxID=1156985 RepID=UPI002491A4B5|nr:hypothetical protein [Epibacterium ulvae]